MGFDFVPRGEGSFSEDTRVAAALILVLLLLGLSNFFFGNSKGWIGGRRAIVVSRHRFPRWMGLLKIWLHLGWDKFISRSKHESRTYPSLETITSPPNFLPETCFKEGPLLDFRFLVPSPPWHRGKDNGVHALGVGQGASGITRHKVNMNHPSAIFLGCHLTRKPLY